jgi:hypothetical protein
VAKVVAIPDLFEGGPSSTQNYRAKSRGNSINLKKVANEFQKISNLVVASQKVFGASPGWPGFGRLGGKFFLYLTNILFLEKLAREILEKIRKKYRPKIIMLTTLSYPKLPRTSFEN